MNIVAKVEVHFHEQERLSVYLESDRGLLITQSQQHGKLFHLWTQQDHAREMNEARYGGMHRASPMDYRELEDQLERMQSAGMRYVTLDHRMNGEGRIVPIVGLLQHVQQTIGAVESSEIGKAMRHGSDE